jgi:hypothetical protein
MQLGPDRRKILQDDQAGRRASANGKNRKAGRVVLEQAAGVVAVRQLELGATVNNQ